MIYPISMALDPSPNIWEGRINEYVSLATVLHVICELPRIFNKSGDINFQILVSAVF